jgi:hypothetical protein
MCNVYIEKVPSVEGIQFDGENGGEIVEFVGGADYGKVSGDEVILTPAGKDPRGTKVTVTRGQFVVKAKTGTKVVNEGEMLSNYTNLDGSLLEAIAPPEQPPPLDEDELVYEPGFRPLTEEEKKAAKKSDKKEAKDAEKKEEAKHHEPEKKW